MKHTKIAAALAVATTAALASSQASAASYSVISSGTATVTFEADFGENHLGTNWADNEEGNPSRTFTLTATRLDENGFPTDSGSQLIDGGADLSVRRGNVYIFPTDAAGEEVESYAEVKKFNYREDDPSVTDDMKDINYVPTGTAGEYTNYETGEALSLTPEQVVLLEDGELRLCCRHTLGMTNINTVEGYIDGIIDSIVERDINLDGVIDENDEFVLFDLEESAEEGIYNLMLSDVLATYLNYGFTPAAFADGDTLVSEWAGYEEGELMGFAGGDTVGTLSYSYETVTTAPVPLPASLPLLAVALGAMGFSSNRRKLLGAKTTGSL